MKKWWIGFAAALMVFVLGTAVYAAEAGDSTFQQMLPFMKKMHPDMSEQQLQDMHNNCAANGGMMSEMHKNMMKSFTSDNK